LAGCKARALSASGLDTYGDDRRSPACSPNSCTETDPADADLRRVVEAWPTLPESVRAGIVAMLAAEGDE